jgi:hypothetical protein
VSLSALAWAQLAVGGLGALIGLLSVAGVWRSLRALPVLDDEPTPAAPEAGWPRVAVVIPACNEAATLPSTLEALLKVDYPALEVVVVDDRSTDDTPALLAAFAARDARVTAVRVDTLPEGWLGKVHALDRGLGATDADWVLFMDADVELAPGCLQRALAHALAHGAALVSAHPEIKTGGVLVDAVFNAVALSLGAARYWEVADKKKATAYSVGAFILVDRAAFAATEGFAWLKLEVADDMALSHLMKRAGHHVVLLNGRGQIVLTWYESFGEMQRKMQKNWFGIMGRCSTPRSFAMAAFLAGFPLLPFTQLAPTDAPLSWRLGLLLVGAVGMMIAVALWASGTARPLLTALVPQLGTLLMAWMLVRSAVIGARLGGIEWRGKLYRSAELNAGRRVFF